MFGGLGEYLNSSWYVDADLQVSLILLSQAGRASDTL